MCCLLRPRIPRLPLLHLPQLHQRNRESVRACILELSLRTLRLSSRSLLLLASRQVDCAREPSVARLPLHLPLPPVLPPPPLRPRLPLLAPPLQT